MSKFSATASASLFCGAVGTTPLLAKTVGSGAVANPAPRDLEGPSQSGSHGHSQYPTEKEMWWPITNNNWVSVSLNDGAQKCMCMQLTKDSGMYWDTGMYSQQDCIKDYQLPVGAPGKKGFDQCSICTNGVEALDLPKNARAMPNCYDIDMSECAKGKGRCTKCKEFHGMDNVKFDQFVDCKKCPVGCKTCSFDSNGASGETSCSECTYGYETYQHGTVPICIKSLHKESCEEGWELTEVYPLDSNRTTCRKIGIDNCDTYHKGTLEHKDPKCKACAKDFHLSPDAMRCVPTIDIADCTMSEITSCKEQPVYSQKCSKCKDATPPQISCGNVQDFNAFFCTGGCKDDHFMSYSKTECVPICQKGCVVCVDGQHSCPECEEGYQLEEGKCVFMLGGH